MKKHSLKFKKVFSNIVCGPLFLIPNNLELFAKYLPNDYDEVLSSLEINNTNYSLFEEFGGAIDDKKPDDKPKEVEADKEDKPKEDKPKGKKSKSTEKYCKLSDTKLRRRCTKTKLKSENSDECLYDYKTNYCRIKKDFANFSSELFKNFYWIR